MPLNTLDLRSFPCFDHLTSDHSRVLITLFPFALILILFCLIDYFIPSTLMIIASSYSLRSSIWFNFISSLVRVWFYSS